MKLPFNWRLPEEIQNRLGQRRAGRQRAMIADGHLLLILHKVPKRGQPKREAVFFWRDPAGEWVSSEKGVGLQKLRRHIESYSVAAEKFARAYEQAETAEGYFRVLEDMAPLHHAARNLHDTLQAAREAVPEDQDIIDVRDWAYDLERELDLLSADAKNALDYHMAKKAEEEALLSRESLRTAHRLNVLAAVFFPLTAIASVFGMNLYSGLEDSSPVLFWLVFLVGIGLGFVTREWVLRRGGRE